MAYFTVGILKEKKLPQGALKIFKSSPEKKYDVVVFQ